jgi:hypothetical protein
MQYPAHPFAIPFGVCGTLDTCTHPPFYLCQEAASWSFQCSAGFVVWYWGAALEYQMEFVYYFAIRLAPLLLLALPLLLPLLFLVALPLLLPMALPLLLPLMLLMALPLLLPLSLPMQRSCC